MLPFLFGLSVSIVAAAVGYQAGKRAARRPKARDPMPDLQFAMANLQFAVSRLEDLAEELAAD